MVAELAVAVGVFEDGGVTIAESNVAFGTVVSKETLAAFAISGFLFVTCYQIASSAIGHFLSPTDHHPEISKLTIGVMLVTIVVNIFVAVYEGREGRRLRSEFLIADAIHTKSDIIVSFSVLVGLGLIKYGLVWLDPVVALGVAVVIAWNGYEIFKATVPVLEKPLDLDLLRQQVRHLLEAA